MTDNHNWLAEYARTGSDAAFRELVTRYVDLVYSTALRLVGGDAHHAEDVAQTVFVNLARGAGTLPKDVTLGGWLHRDTCFTAATLMRGERRRQARERQAAEMNALQNTSKMDYSLVAPVLDEAINELGDEDRTAILLRFFEQHDFRSVGAVLGSTEDAARMRVNRALEKLEGFLKRQGITTTAASLGVALSANAVQAAPVGLAVTISTAAALTGTTFATTATVTTKAIAMTALQKTVVTATIAVLAGVGMYEARQAANARDEVQTLRQQEAPLVEQIRQLQSSLTEVTNRLAELSADYSRLKSNPNEAELLRLRGEVGLLRQQANEAEGKLATALSYTAKFTKDENATAQAMKNLNLVMMQWALDHDEKFATNLMQLANELKKPYIDTNTLNSVYSFDFVNAGVVTPKDPKMLILRERFARQAPDGTWRRIYGFADGRAITAVTTDGNFEAWEKVNTESPPQK